MGKASRERWASAMVKTKKPYLLKLLVRAGLAQSQAELMNVAQAYAYLKNVVRKGVGRVRKLPKPTPTLDQLYRLWANGFTFETLKAVDASQAETILKAIETKETTELALS